MTTESKSWEQHVSEARAAYRANGSTPAGGAVTLRAELACTLEQAHARALREAEQLVADATRLAERLRDDGIGVIVSGNGFHGEAQKLRDALVALEGAREAFSTAIRIQRMGESGA